MKEGFQRRMNDALKARRADPLRRLIYVSQASELFDEATLVDYCNQFALANAAMDLTGLLIHIGGRFMQVLEGEGSKIKALMSRIKRDPRHRKVQVVITETMTCRMFSHWNMALLDFQSPEAHQRFDLTALAGLGRLIENIDNRVDAKSEVVRLVKMVPRLMKVYRLPRAGRTTTESVQALQGKTA